MRRQPLATAAVLAATTAWIVAPSTILAQDLDRQVEQLRRDGAQVCRFPGEPEEACTTFDGRTISEEAMQDYEAGWIHRALTLQRRLDENVPLREGMIPATHNSFNSAAYYPTLSGLDHNQVVSLTDQLRLGMRGLELDVHWVPSLLGDPGDGGFAPVLCHGQVQDLGGTPFHLGCTVERHLRDGLAEIKAWLVANPNELVLLYLENALDGLPEAHDAAVRAIEEELGDGLVIRPPDSATCTELPVTKTRRQLLEENPGKQIILTGNCGPGDWRGWVHVRGSAWSEGSSDPGDDYPGSSGCAALRTSANYASKFVRIFEDSTWLTATAGDGPREITLADAANMARCGVNLFGFDQLGPDDSRLGAIVWSWAENQPPDPAGSLECAKQADDGRFHAESCSEMLRFACRTSTGEWKVPTAVGEWADGQSTCVAEFPGSSFSVPATGYDNELLKAARIASGADMVWLDYKAIGGVWTPEP